jgi:uncharacterized protein YjbJ (UPF0337 family)
MDKDRISGSAKDFADKVEGAAGDIAGDTKAQIAGRTREAAGAVQNPLRASKRVCARGDRRRNQLCQRGLMRTAATRSTMYRELYGRGFMQIRLAR